MNKIEEKIRNVVGDITIQDMVVCPIDDHVTIGVQFLFPELITYEQTPIVEYNIYIRILNPYLI